MDNPQKAKIFLVISAFVLFTIFVLGMFFIAVSDLEKSAALTLSFVAGLSMIFLPCTLPLVFVVVPLALKGSPLKGLMIAALFGLGLSITLSIYGVAIAYLGGWLGLVTATEWMFTIGGTAAFVFGLAELKFINLKIPGYGGNLPNFIQTQGDYVKSFLLGLFLGNAGVGCPNPAFYILLGYIATTGDLFTGGYLGFIHGVGRVIPLIFLAILAILGVSATGWVSRQRERVEGFIGWGLLYIGAFIFMNGMFGHDWYVQSGLHTMWEKALAYFFLFVSWLTGSEALTGKFSELIESHHNVISSLYFRSGNWVMVTLISLPLVWNWFRKKKELIILEATPQRDEVAVAVKKKEVVKSGIKYAIAIALFIFLFVRFFPSTVLPTGEENGGHGAMLPIMVHEEKDIQEGVVVNFSHVPNELLVGTQALFNFLVRNLSSNSAISVSSLELEHTKLMHVVGVRNDMNEFFHIHPNPSSTVGLLSADYIFPQPGLYKIWSEIKKDGINHAFGHEPFNVLGEGTKEDKNVSFGRNVIVDKYQVALKLEEPVAKGHEHDLSFDVHSFDGREVEVEDFLGAPMHLSIIKDDWKQFIHTHPGEGMMDMEGKPHGVIRLISSAKAHGEADEGQKEDAISFHVVFPEAGLYKVFAQFRPLGSDLPPDQAYTASFWVEVKEGSAIGISSWWGLLIVSLVAISTLSWVVRRYLQVKI